MIRAGEGGVLSIRYVVPALARLQILSRLACPCHPAAALLLISAADEMAVEMGNAVSLAVSPRTRLRFLAEIEKKVLTGPAPSCKVAES